MVQLAVGQVPLHQVYVLLAGGARAAGGPVGALLRQAAGGALLTLQGTGWGQGHQPFVQEQSPFPCSLVAVPQVCTVPTTPSEPRRGRG